MNPTNKLSRNFSRRGSFAPILMFGAIAIGLLGVTVYFLVAGENNTLAIDPILTSVEKGEFVAQVLDQGEVQSSENVEIRCEVRARNGAVSVIEVVNEGSRVSEGDFLVRLDSTSFEKEMESQKIAVANAQTAVIQAQAAKATAVESLKEYEQGILVEKKKLIENDIYDSKSLIATSQQDLTQAKAVLEHSKKLHGKGFITTQQLEVDGFEVKRAEFALKTANNKLELAEKQLDVLDRITRVKETVQLKSDIDAAKVKLVNQEEAFKIEQEKLKEIENQIEKCVIKVPANVQGQVVYAKESSRGGNDWVLEEGTSVRERQVLIRLPNPDKMEVKALINEQSITQIKKGMPCSINVDALSNQTLTGVVTKVNQYAESSGWMSSSIRKYAVLVEIIAPPEALKPGMNAAVTIEVRHEQDAIKAPIQAVYAVQDRHYCLVKRGENDWETREIEVDGDNSQMVLVTSGLKPGEELVMNPGAFKELMQLPELKLDRKIAISEDMQSRMDSLKSGSPGNTEQPAKVAATATGTAAGRSGADGGRGERDGGRSGRGGERRGGGRGGRGGPPGGGTGGFSMPENGAALIKDKDRDGDGKLTKDEAGSPYSFFFDRVDTDSDGFIDEAEADKSIASMKKRMQQMQSGGGGGGPRL